MSVASLGAVVSMRGGDAVDGPEGGGDGDGGGCGGGGCGARPGGYGGGDGGAGGGTAESNPPSPQLVLMWYSPSWKL